MSDCVFCKIRDGQIPSIKLYEDARTLCIMDINPLNAGHCLVLTRAHAPTLFDADPADLAAAITTAQRVARAQQTALRPDGLHLTPEQIVATAVQEDADAIGLSVLSGAHNYLFQRVLELLAEQGAGDIAVFGGGIIPPEDIAGLKAMGVKELFTPGTSTQDIVRFVREHIRAAV